jgi:hypothetical protein
MGTSVSGKKKTEYEKFSRTRYAPGTGEILEKN